MTRYFVNNIWCGIVHTSTVRNGREIDLSEREVEEGLSRYYGEPTTLLPSGTEVCAGWAGVDEEWGELIPTPQGPWFEGRLSLLEALLEEDDDGVYQQSGRQPRVFR